MAVSLDGGAGGAVVPAQDCVRAAGAVNIVWNNSKRDFAPSDAAHADDDVHALDRGSLRRRGHARNCDGVARDVDQAAFVLAIEMLMITDIRIEIGSRCIDHNLTEQPCSGELMQCVVNRSERNLDAGILRFGMKPFCRQMTVAVTEKNARQLQTLPRRTQSRRPEPECGFLVGTGIDLPAYHQLWNLLRG